MSHPATRQRVLVFVALCGALVAAGCSGSAPRPAPTTTPSSLPECAWGEAAINATDRAIAITTNDAVYELVDTSSGQVLGRCPTSGADGVASYLAAYQAPTIDGRTAADETFNALWFGGFRPGGASGTVVVTSSGTVDLADGQRVATSSPGLRPTAVARAGIVMVRDGAGTASTPPSQPDDWCILPLSGQGTCEAIGAAAGAGTPVITSDGAVAWLPTELVRTDIAIDADDPTSTVYLRSGAGLVTATAYVNDGAPASFDDGLVSATGRAFLVSPGRSSTANLAGSGRPRWYTVDASGGLVAHQAQTTYLDLAELLGADPSSLLVTDTAVTDDGRTVLMTVNRNSAPVLVAVPEQGNGHVVFDAAAPDTPADTRGTYLAVGDRFVTSVGISTN